MSKYESASVQMSNGQVFDGKRIGELVGYIINKFSEENLSHDEAEIVLSRTKDILGEVCFFKV